MDYPVAKDPEAEVSASSVVIYEFVGDARQEIVASIIWKYFGRGFDKNPERSVETKESFMDCAKEIIRAL